MARTWPRLPRGSHVGTRAPPCNSRRNSFYHGQLPPERLLNIRFTIRSENPTEGLLLSIDLLTCYLATGRTEEARSLGVEIDRATAKQMPGTAATQAIARLRRVVAGAEIGDALQRAATARAAVVAGAQRPSRA